MTSVYAVPTLSYSTYDTMMVCGKRVIWKRQGTRGPLSANLVYGQTYHYAMRKYVLEDTDPRRAVHDCLEAYFSGTVPAGERPQDNWDGSISILDKDSPRDVMETWIPDAIRKYLDVCPGKPQSMELYLTKDYGTHRVVGYLDAIKDGKVIDYKLGNARYKPNPLQAAFYAVLLGGVPIQFEFHLVRKKTNPEIEIIPIPEVRNPAYIKFVEQHIIPGAAHLLTLDDLPANPEHFLCSEAYCQYWDACIGKALGSKAKEVVV